MTAPRRRSLRLELIATLSVILMMAVVSLSLATELLGRRRHAEAQRQQLSSHVQGLSALVMPRLGSATQVDREEIEQALRTSIGTLGIEAIEIVRIVNDRAQPMVSVGLAPDTLAPPVGIDTTQPEHVHEHDDLTIVDRPLRTFGERPGEVVLRVVARPAPWTRVQDWPEILVLALGVGAVLLTLGILLLEMQVLRPLARVRGAVGSVAMGHLDARAPEDGPAEVQALAGAFNQMAEALQARVREIEEQRERLVRSEQLASVGRISAGIAHEVGNPLAAILGYVELLLDPRTDPALTEEQRGLLQRSREQIQRIQGIVTQLLEYSRPSRKRLQAVPVVEASRQLLSLLRHDPRCRDVTLEVEGDAQAIAHADPALLDQVLQNLVVNAARAAGQGEGSARVRIVVETEDDRVHVDVQDTGRGVPDEARDRLFEPFFTTAKAGEGTGLGLAICQGLAASMDGELRLRSAAGHVESFPGAVFRVTLPRHASGAKAPKEPSHTS
jgi:two-component system NtrC family sensor kinase